jgi:amidase
MQKLGAMNDPYHAFCTDCDAYLEGRGSGPLSGFRFAAKDLFDVKGYRTGGGNPDWRDTHAPAQKTAWAIERLVEAGATMVGKTITDEVSRGIFGENAFYGTPTNPRAPDRVPGGSSSGSAAAVAGHVVDFALGTDTGGSVRVPSSFCGLYGIRTTHGRVPIEGVIAQAPSFDTVGWMARDARTFAYVSAVVLQRNIEKAKPARVLMAEDAFEVAQPLAAQALRSYLDVLSELGVPVESCSLASEECLEELARQQGILQGREAWTTFFDWIDTHNPRFSFEVADNFLRGTHADEKAIASANVVRAKVRERLSSLTTGETLIALPTTPFAAPLRGQKRSAMWALRKPVMALTCIAGMAGTPQISLPVAEVEGLPIGLSLIGARGSDELLAGFALALDERARSNVAS